MRTTPTHSASVRPEGQQYLQKIKTTLPSGLVGEIPDVTLCAEPQAAAGTCGAASRIGTATVTAGSGSSPYSFSGPVYMTGPYNGAPFGLSINVPAVAGPFNLGPVVTRSTINVNPATARVTAETTLPTIVKGVPLRLRSLSVNVNRQGFLLNPTNCSTEYTETSLTSTFGGDADRAQLAAPGGRLQLACLQARVHGVHGRQALERKRGEPCNDAHGGGRPVEHQIGVRDAA